MKSILGLLLFAALIGGTLHVFAPESAKALVSRAEHYFDAVPPVPPVQRPPSDRPPPQLSPAPPVSAEWRRADREAQRLYEDGDFPGAAEAWAAAGAKAPAAEVLRLRAAKDRALVFSLLAAGTVPVSGVDRAAAEAEYRRRLETMRDPSAGVWLELAEYAAARGLRHHLAFLYEHAFERRHQPGEAVSRQVTKVLKERKEAVAALPRGTLEAVMSELPASEAAREAADLVEEEEDPGIAGSRPRERMTSGIRAQDTAKLAEARDCMVQGDAEYRLAVPGTRDVNVHRRKALDLYVKARDLYEQVDRESGFSSHESEIHDLNRNIAELRKDLPVGK